MKITIAMGGVTVCCLICRC